MNLKKIPKFIFRKDFIKNLLFKLYFLKNKAGFKYSMQIFENHISKSGLSLFFKILFPWQLKLILKILISKIALKNNLSKFGIFKHGNMDNIKYLMQIFENHLSRAGITLEKLDGSIILEVGPGNSIGTALVAASCSARSYLVDSEYAVNNSLLFYNDLYDELVKRKLNPPDIRNAKNIQSILDLCNSKYFIEGVKSFEKIPNNSVDFIFSQAVLEHIDKSHFEIFLNETKRILKKDGVCSHRVDLSDHLGGKLNNLRFSEKVWESKLFKNSGFYTNRLRCIEILDLCKKCGFKIKNINKKFFEVDPNIKKAKLDKRFRKFSEKELMIRRFDIVLCN